MKNAQDRRRFNFMSNTIEAEVVQPDNNMAVAVRQAQPVGLFGTNEPAAVVEKATSVANALKAVIVKQGLVSKISGKEYPRCEAWTLLGTMLGVFPVTVWTKQLDDGWEARVEAKTRDGATIGAAEAQCLRSEKNWSNRDDFALRSMAQTRATAKCLRMPLGFVMTLAGFEATPAEEMSFDGGRPLAASQPKTPPSTPPPQSSKAPPPVKPKEAKTPPPLADEQTRAKMIRQLHDCIDLATEYFRKLSNPAILMDNETLEDVGLEWIPITLRQFEALKERITAFGNGEEATHPYKPNPRPAPIAATVAKVMDKVKPIEVPRDEETATPEAVEEWRQFPMPWGKQAGTILEELDKKYLYGLWANYEVETEYEGKPKRPETIAKDQKFREHLDACGEHYGFQKND